MINSILNLIYPPVCGVCGKIDKNTLCNKCKIELKKHAIYGVDDYSLNFEINFDEHLYIFMYSDIIRKILIDYKFNDRSYLYKTFIKFLLKNEKSVEFIKSYDIIVPVPLNKKRKKERGYNQSELIARELSNETNIQMVKDCIIKVKNVEAQSSLNKEERQKNIQGVYELINTKDLDGKKVLIIDDVYTTGSTINECSKVLSKAHTSKIGALTIAKD